MNQCFRRYGWVLTLIRAKYNLFSQFQDIKVKVLPPGEKTTLVVLDTSLIQTGAISCVLESDLGEIDRMTALFADYVKEAKGPYTPR